MSKHVSGVWDKENYLKEPHGNGKIKNRYST